MLDIIQGLLAIVFVIFILSMKESTNRIISTFGIGIMLLAKVRAGNPEFPTVLYISILLTLLAIIIYRQYHLVKKTNEELELLMKMTENHTLEQISEIASLELELRKRLAMVEILFRNGEINKEEYEDNMTDLAIAQLNIMEKYNVTENEMVEYYRYLSE